MSDWKWGRAPFSFSDQPVLIHGAHEGHVSPDWDYDNGEAVSTGKFRANVTTRADGHKTPYRVGVCDTEEDARRAIETLFEAWGLRANANPNHPDHPDNAADHAKLIRLERGADKLKFYHPDYPKHRFYSEIDTIRNAQKLRAEGGRRAPPAPETC